MFPLAPPPSYILSLFASPTVTGPVSNQYKTGYTVTLHLVCCTLLQCVVQNDNNNVSGDQSIILQLCLLVKAKGVSNQSHGVSVSKWPLQGHMTSKVRVNPEVRNISEDTLQQEEVPETLFFPSFRSSVRSFHCCLKENPAFLFM